MPIDVPSNRLRELRQAQGDLKIYDIAARFRVDPSTVARWERGESTMPDDIKLALAATYGVTPAYLMGWPETVADTLALVGGEEVAA